MKWFSVVRFPITKNHFLIFWATFTTLETVKEIWRENYTKKLATDANNFHKNLIPNIQFTKLLLHLRYRSNFITSLAPSGAAFVIFWVVQAQFSDFKSNLQRNLRKQSCELRRASCSTGNQSVIWEFVWSWNSIENNRRFSAENTLKSK